VLEGAFIGYMDLIGTNLAGVNMNGSRFQLAIIMEKEGRFKDAIALSHQAESQGWAGAWARRVERCEKKLERVGAS